MNTYETDSRWALQEVHYRANALRTVYGLEALANKMVVTPSLATTIEAMIDAARVLRLAGRPRTAEAAEALAAAASRAAAAAPEATRALLHKESLRALVKQGSAHREWADPPWAGNSRAHI